MTTNSLAIDQKVEHEECERAIGVAVEYLSDHFSYDAIRQAQASEEARYQLAALVIPDRFKRCDNPHQKMLWDYLKTTYGLTHPEAFRSLVREAIQEFDRVYHVEA